MRLSSKIHKRANRLVERTKMKINFLQQQNIKTKLICKELKTKKNEILETINPI